LPTTESDTGVNAASVRFTSLSIDHKASHDSDRDILPLTVVFAAGFNKVAIAECKEMIGGATVGAVVGWAVGIAVGITVGAVLGEALGLPGTTVGPAVGDGVGSAVGLAVGSLVGE